MTPTTARCSRIFASRSSRAPVMPRCPPSPSRSSLQDRGHAHPARGADRDQPAALAALLELFCERRDDPRSGRGEGMAERDARALRVELAAVDRAERRFALELVAAVVGGL